jgi:hypothetical protein
MMILTAQREEKNLSCGEEVKWNISTKTNHVTRMELRMKIPTHPHHEESRMSERKKERNENHGEGTTPNAVRCLSNNGKERSFVKILATLMEEETQVGVRVPSPK